MTSKSHRATRASLGIAALLAASCGAPAEEAKPASAATIASAPASAAKAASATPAQDLTPPALRLPAMARPSRYDLDLTIDPSRDTFTGTIGVDLTIDAATSLLWLNGTELTIKEARLASGGKEQPARPVPGGDDFVGFALDTQASPGLSRLTITYEGRIDKDRSRGLYRESEGAGPDDAYAYTFFEPIDARRAFPCFDEPNYKVPWKITLRVKQNHVALANSRVEKETALPGGMKAVTFEETKPLPSYLVALIVGPFDLIDAGTAGHHGTKLRFAVPRGRGAETRYAAQVTPTIVGLLEDYFGMPYPYGKLDVAVVPRFWGTMEHPGLVALGQPLTLIKPAEETPQRKRRYANIAIHELAHYWFGDYVTMRFWDDTWLNESLASWMDAKVTHALEPAWGIDVDRIAVRSFAMAQDSLAAAKKVRQPITSKDDIANAFDGAITYAKGSSVIGMFEASVGALTFQKGIQRYMREHAWGSAVADDLLSALSAEAGRDLGPAMKTFLDQPGVPLVTAEPLCSAGTPPRLKLTQSRFVPLGSKVSPGGLFRVPVCVKYGGPKGAGKACTSLDAPSIEIPLDPAKGCPAWVMPNEGASGYYRSSYAPETLRALLHQDAKGKDALTPKERVSLITDMEALVTAGKLGRADALALLPAMVKGADRHALGSSMALVEGVRDDLLPDDLRKKLAKLVRDVYGERARALGFAGKPGEPDEARLLRPRLLGLVGILGEDPALRKEAHALALRFLGDHAAIAPDLTQVTLAIAAQSDDPALFRGLREAGKAAPSRRDKEQILSVLGAFRASALADEALALVLSPELDLRDTTGILDVALFGRETRERAYAFVKKNFAALTARMRSDEAMPLFDMPVFFCEEAHRRDAEAFFGERARAVEGATRTLASALEASALCIEQQKHDEAGLHAFLKKL
jgi:cytosol alanyl aminopeptidase